MLQFHELLLANTNIMFASTCPTQFKGLPDDTIINILKHRPLFPIIRISSHDNVQIVISCMAKKISGSVMFFYKILRK